VTSPVFPGFPPLSCFAFPGLATVAIGAAGISPFARVPVPPWRSSLDDDELLDFEQAHSNADTHRHNTQPHLEFAILARVRQLRAPHLSQSVVAALSARRARGKAG
jgi:hypothetical protein